MNPGQEKEATWSDVRRAYSPRRQWHMLRAMVWHRLGRHEASLRALDAALRLYGDSATQLFRASALEHLDRREEALTSYRRAIELDPRNEEAHRQAGAALLEWGEPDQALTHIQDALRLNAANSETQLLAARCFGKLGREREAQRHFDEALRLDPGAAL